METNADLSDLLYELLESVLSSKGLVNKVLAVIVKVSQFERGVVLLETHDHDLELKAHVGISSGGLRSIQNLCTAFVTESSNFSSAVSVADTRRGDKFQKLSALKGSDILSFTCIPLKVEDKTVGILYLGSTIVRIENRRSGDRRRHRPSIL